MTIRLLTWSDGGDLFLISLCLEGLQALGAGTNERERKWGSGGGEKGD